MRHHIVAAPYDESFHSQWCQFVVSGPKVERVTRLDVFGAYKAARSAHSDCLDLTITRRPVSEIISAKGKVDLEVLDIPYGDGVYSLLCPFGLRPSERMWCLTAYRRDEVISWKKVGVTPFYNMPVPAAVDNTWAPQELMVRPSLLAVDIVPEAKAIAERFWAQSSQPSPKPTQNDMDHDDYRRAVQRVRSRRHTESSSATPRG